MGFFFGTVYFALMLKEKSTRRFRVQLQVSFCFVFFSRKKQKFNRPGFQILMKKRSTA